MKPTKNIFGGGKIDTDLQGKLFQRRKLPFVTQARKKTDRNGFSVKVITLRAADTTAQMGFHGQCAVVGNRRRRPDVGDRAPECIAAPAAGGVNAAFRQKKLRIRQKICRRQTEGGSDMSAVNHLAGERDRPSEQLRRPLHVTVRKKRADPRGRHRCTVRKTVKRNRKDPDSVFRRQRSQLRAAAESASAEAEILTADQKFTLVLCAEKVQIFPRPGVGKRPVKRLKKNRIRAEREKKTFLFRIRCQFRNRIPGMKKCFGMLGKRQNNRRGFPRTRLRDGTADDIRVTEMDAIEISDNNNRHIRSYSVGSLRTQTAFNPFSLICASARKVPSSA